MKKMLAIVLALMMVLSMVPMAVAETAEPALVAEKGLVIYGSSTDIGGDFAPTAWWTNGSTDMMIRDMTNDYATVTTNQGGEYVVNETIVTNMESVENDDGTKTYTMTIAEGLTYNNGKAMNAKDFVWPTVLACSKVLFDLEGATTTYTSVEGGQDYYDGKVPYVSGLRLIDDYTFSVTIAAEKLPYYYDLGYAAFTAFDIAYWLGEGYELKDDGEGCYIAGDFTADAIKAQMEYARFNAGPDRVSAGPYNLVEFDKAALQATLTINPYYVGNFEGQKPSIEKIVIVKAEDATWADAIKTGSMNFYDTITDGAHINTALDIIEEGGFDYVQFDRPGYGMVNFACDFGPTQFINVRQAIAKLLDRVEFANTFCLGWGGVVNGPYGTAMWQYKEAEEWLNENLDAYAYNPEEAVALLVEDGWIYNADGSEWTEGNIRHKKVTAEEAGTYVHNITLADGTILMPLIVEWSSSEANPVSDLLKVMLAESDATKAAGLQINQNVMTFTELLNFYYRDSSQGDKYAIPTYGMFNLATNFSSAAYDMSYEWTDDPDLVALGYNLNHLFDDVLDWLSMEMVYGVSPEEPETYLILWQKYMQRWNELMPQLPLYSNVYITMYPDWLEGYEQDSYWGFDKAILYATVAE